MKIFHFLIFPLIFLFVFQTSFAQKWTYRTGGNAFDGKYKIAFVQGSGGEFPYTKPLFVVNYFENSVDLNIYISNAGYAGCDSKKIYIKFDRDESIYEFKVLTNSDKDSWFFTNYNFDGEKYITNGELLDKLKKYSKVSVRLKSNCGQTDYEFPLYGSGRAIDYVYTPYSVALKKKADDLLLQMGKVIARKKAELDSLKLKNWLDSKRESELDSLFDVGVLFEAKTKFDCMIYEKPTYEWAIQRIKKNELVNIIKYDNKFYEFLSNDVMLTSLFENLYLSKDCINISSIKPLMDSTGIKYVVGYSGPLKNNKDISRQSKQDRDVAIEQHLQNGGNIKAKTLDITSVFVNPSSFSKKIGVIDKYNEVILRKYNSMFYQVVYNDNIDFSQDSTLYIQVKDVSMRTFSIE